MPAPIRFAVILASVGLAGCQSGPLAVVPPPLARPAPDVEVVEVSSEIATPSHPVFYFRDAKDQSSLLAYDWSGVLKGTLRVSASEPYGVSPSADGTHLLLLHGHLTSGGRVLGHTANGKWAGVNAHLCAFLNRVGGPPVSAPRQVGPNTFVYDAIPGTLFYESLDGSSRRVLDFGQFGRHGGPTVLACSAANDRAVIAGSFVGTMSGLEVVRLSDGKVIAHGPNPPQLGPDGTVVSADGTLLGIGSTGGISVPGGTNAFTVYSLPENGKVARIAGGGIEAFSADDTRALIVEDTGGSNERRTYQLINLVTSRSLWKAELSPGTVLTRPGSGDFLVASRSFEPSLTRANGNDPFEDVWLVSADGSARLLLKHVPPLT